MKQQKNSKEWLHWFNPRTGETIKIGVAETRKRFGVSPSSEEDWVLVMDDESLKLPAPGTIGIK